MPAFREVQGVTSVAFLPNGTPIAMGQWTNQIRLWNLENMTQVSKLPVESSNRGITISPDGKFFVFGSVDDTTLRIWHRETGRQIQELISGSVRCVAFSPDGKLVASGSHDTRIRIWNVETGQQLQKLQGHTDWVNCIAFSPDSKFLASGSDDTTLRIWDVETGEQIQELTDETGPVHSVAFSPDGKLLASGSDKAIRLWKPVIPKKPSRWFDFLTKWKRS